MMFMYFSDNLKKTETNIFKKKLETVVELVDRFYCKLVSDNLQGVFSGYLVVFLKLCFKKW